MKEDEGAWVEWLITLHVDEENIIDELRCEHDYRTEECTSQSYYLRN
jgi:hypothetical protein